MDIEHFGLGILDMDTADTSNQIDQLAAVRDSPDSLSNLENTAVDDLMTTYSPPLSILSHSMIAEGRCPDMYKCKNLYLSVHDFYAQYLSVLEGQSLMILDDLLAEKSFDGPYGPERDSEPKIAQNIVAVADSDDLTNEKSSDSSDDLDSDMDYIPEKDSESDSEDCSDGEKMIEERPEDINPNFNPKLYFEETEIPRVVHNSTAQDISAFPVLPESMSHYNYKISLTELSDYNLFERL